MSFPLLKECENEITTTFDNGMFSKRIKYEIHQFNYPLPVEFSKNLIGYVTVNLMSSPDNDYDGYLKSIINGPVLNCYPKTAIEIPYTDLGIELKGKLEFNERIGDKSQYLVLKNDALSIVSNK